MRVKVGNKEDSFRTVSYDPEHNQVILIDQRKLPHKFSQLRTASFQQTAESIKNMTVRGAGAIGATAAYGFAQGIRMSPVDSGSPDFITYVDEVFSTLGNARPTAVDPMNALKWMRKELISFLKSRQKIELNDFILQLAKQFALEDIQHCQKIGEYGAPLLTDGINILTHCNAGWLAFVDVGSATAPIYTAHKEGVKLHVYCDETRPRLQGASLTAWELYNNGIDHTIIPDNAAGHLMQLGKIDIVVVGSDRVIARTGDVANKIGTFTKAVLAKRFNIPFYVAIPLSTLDWDLSSGDEIPIETRDQSEVLNMVGLNSEGEEQVVRIANPESKAVNYGFDVTPAELITGIITPNGIFKPNELWENKNILNGSV